MLLPWACWAGLYYQGENYTDEWGVGWNAVEYKTKYGIGKYIKIVNHPLSKDEDIEAYIAPDPERPELYFDTAWALRDLEKLLIDFIDKPEIAELVLQMPFNYHLTSAKINIDYLGKLSEAVKIPLVLYGGSGININDIRKSFRNGITKINIGTEIRQAF